MIMQGFLRVRVPIIVRRLVTMIPAFVVVWLGVNSTSALIMSQVVLSIALPAPVIALLIFTSRKDIMGAFANSRLTNVAACFAALVILALNAVLLLQAFGVEVPGLSERLTERRELVAQRLVFRFQRLEPLAQWRERGSDLSFAETRDDMLRAVPVEGDEMDDKPALDLCSVAGERQLGGQLRISRQISRLHMRIELEASPVGIVHQDQ